METQIFNYKKDEIRTVKENEILWFVAKDICEILEYQNVTDTLEKRIDEDEKKLIYLTDTSGQKRKVWIINEFGLYSLILSSTKPEAKEFKRWITHEVLPSIRKAGKFSSGQAEHIAIENQLIIKRKNEISTELKSYKSTIKGLNYELFKLTEKLHENIINPQMPLPFEQ